MLVAYFQVMKYARQRLPTLNEYCVICDEPHVFQNGAMLKVPLFLAFHFNIHILYLEDYIHVYFIYSLQFVHGSFACLHFKHLELCQMLLKILQQELR